MSNTSTTTFEPAGVEATSESQTTGGQVTATTGSKGRSRASTQAVFSED